MKGKYAFLIVFIIPLLTGCWSRTEINDLAIVVGLAIDKVDDENIQLSLQIANPKALGATGSSQGSSGKKSTLLISAKGESIMGVYRIIQEKLPREVFFAHSRVIIIGEDLARDDVSPVLDFFSRSREAHLRSFILFTKGKAIDILKLNPRLESIMAEEIREQEKTEVGLRVRVRDFIKSMLTDGEEPVAAQISSLSLEEPQGVGSSKKTPAINGAAVFRGGHLVGWLNDKEARGVKWIRNELKSGVMTVMVPVEKGGGKIGAKILKVSTSIKPIFKNGLVKIKLKVDGDIAISENSSRLDLSDPRVLRSLSPIFEEAVKTRIQLTIAKVQTDYQSDIFGFGQAIYRANPKKWKESYKKNWPKTFQKLEVEITPTITINGTGFSTKSMTVQDIDK